MEAVWIASAFVLGLALRHLGMPPLIGFLVAGFALNAFDVQGRAALEHIAHLGVLLLLFTVGLKLKLKAVLRPEVWGGGLIHLSITILLLAPAIAVLAKLSWALSVMLAIALGFSSTVLAAKVLTEKRELKSFHGRVAIGILIIQDLVAVALLSIAAGQTPSPFAVSLFALPLLRPLIYRLLDLSGHGELLILFGMLLALGVGGFGFEALGLSSELGALIMGALIAEHRKSGELYGALWGLKELLLVGFFLQIGMSGLPSLHDLGIALVLAALLPLKAVLFFLILIRFKLRARSAFLTSLSLFSYSEFGLIVANIAAKNGWLSSDWLVLLAVTVAVSFVVASPIFRVAHDLFELYETKLAPYELEQRHPDEQPMSLGDAQILIIGMGKVASAAYDHLSELGHRVIGLDSDQAKVAEHLDTARNVVYGDAEDPGLWSNLDVSRIEAVMLAMPETEAKLLATNQLRKRGYRGIVSAISGYPEDAVCITDAGANHCFNYTTQAGQGFAENVLDALSGERAQFPSEPVPKP